MVEKKYFNLIMDAKDKIGGTLYAPKETDTLLIKDAKDVIGWRNLVFTLKNGIYTPYHMANIGCNLLSDEFKDTIEEFIPIDYPVEFLPVKVQSEDNDTRHNGSWGENMYKGESKVHRAGIAYVGFGSLKFGINSEKHVRAPQLGVGK